MLWKLPLPLPLPLLVAALLAADVRATYHLSPGDPRLVAAQSYAQTRNNGRPPLRTLNPASKVQEPCSAAFTVFKTL